MYWRGTQESYKWSKIDTTTEEENNEEGSLTNGQTWE